MTMKLEVSKKARIHDKLEGLIASRGWAVVTVAGVDEPGYSYSVGLASKHLPEVIVFGAGSEEGPRIINDASRIAIECGPFKVNHPLEGLVSNFKVVLRHLTSAEVKTFLKAAVVRSAGALSAVQIVWPDPNGRFPWEGGFNKQFGPFQPILGPHPLNLVSSKGAPPAPSAVPT